jgi:hypothetical protein
MTATEQIAAMSRCSRCDGVGSIPYEPAAPGSAMWEECSICRGTGHPLVKDPVCEGTGHVGPEDSSGLWTTCSNCIDGLIPLTEERVAERLLAVVEALANGDAKIEDLLTSRKPAPGQSREERSSWTERMAGWAVLVVDGLREIQSDFRAALSALHPDKETE